MGALLPPTPAILLGRKEEMSQCFNKACALPPLGHGVGVNRVINLVMILIWGHDTWRKRKGTLDTAANPRFGMALCPSSGRWHNEGKLSCCRDTCPLGKVLPLLLAGSHSDLGAMLNRGECK